MVVEKEEFNIFESSLVPKHEVIPEDEKRGLLERLKIKESQMPKIKAADPAVKAIEAQKGDVIRITRASPVAGEHFYYRIVV